MDHPTPDPVELGFERRPLVGVAAAVSAAALWGGGTVASHEVLGMGVPAGPFTAIELVSSVVFLVLVCLGSGTTIPSPRRWWRAGSIGILEPGIVYLVMNIGLANTSATHGSLINALQPVLIVLIGWGVLGHALPARLWIPMALVLGGTAAVITENGSGSGASLKGDVLVLIGTVIAAIYVLLASRVVSQLPPLALTLLQQLFAIAVIVPIIGLQVALAGGIGPGPENPATWLWVPVIGVLTSAITFWLYLTALRHLSAGSAGQFLAVIPLVGFAGSVAVLGEPAGPQALIGALVVAGALMAVARMEHTALDEVQAGAATDPVPQLQE